MPSSPPPPGVYVPAVLFFTPDDELDLDAIRSHILRLANGGVTGILVQGSNGEAQHLSHEERSLAIRTTRSCLDENGFKSVIVIAGTGAQSTRETKLLNVEAKQAGAAFALVLTPSTWAPQMTKSLILSFHREVADASPIPVMVYNFPTVTAGIDLDSDIISALAEHPNIVGTKLSCGNVAKAHRLTLSHSRDQFAVFLGKSDAFLPGLIVGSSGVIGALPNLAPRVHVKLYEVYRDGHNVDEAMKIQEILSRADWAMGKLGSVAGLKAAIEMWFGYGNGAVRGPLVPLDRSTLSKHTLETDWLLKLVDLERTP